MGPRNFAGPYVTGVGATMSYFAEIASGLSGGGFSILYRTPKYQREAVADYLDRKGLQADYACANLYESVHSRGPTQPILTM
jgi:hypothetical protein